MKPKKIPDDLPIRLKKTIKDDIVRVTEPAFSKIIELTTIMEGLEFGCVSCANKEEENNGFRTIIDFMISHEQKVSSGNCELTTIGCTLDLKKIKYDRLKAIGIAHGHGHNGVFHSTRDDRTLEEKIIPSCHGNNRQIFPSDENPEYKISRVSSIVVNISRRHYVELNYRIKNLKDGSKPWIFAVETDIEECLDKDNYLEFTRADLIKDLVSKVLFPREIYVPKAFKEYYKEYTRLKSKHKRDKEKINLFAEKIANYCFNYQAPHRVTLMNFIDRLNHNFSERLKFEYDSTNERSYFTHVKDLLTFVFDSDQCPDWMHKFKGYFTEEYRNEDQVVEKFLGELKGEYKLSPTRRPTKEISIADLRAMKQKQKEKALIAEPVGIIREKDERIYVATDIDKYLLEMEKLYKTEKDPELGMLFAYAKIAMLLSHTKTSFQDLESVMDENVHQFLISKEEKINNIFDSINDKKCRVDLLLTDIGYPISKKIEITPVNNKRVIQGISSIIREEIKNIQGSALDLLTYKENLPREQIITYIERTGKAVNELQKNKDIIMKYAQILPEINQTNSILIAQKQDLHQQTIKAIKNTGQMIKQYKNYCLIYGEDDEKSTELKQKILHNSKEIYKLPDNLYFHFKKKIKKLMEAA